MLGPEKSKELKATMFYMDSTDTTKYETDNIEDLACLDRFVTNVNPDKKFYLRHLPVLRSMTDKEPRFFLEEVVEIVSLLLKRSSNSKEVISACPSDEIVPKTITLKEVEKIFEDCDLDKRMIMVTPDTEYSLHNDCRLGYIEQLYFMDRREKPFVYPALAIYKIFNECVLGLNWTTNTCTQHVNCNENRRKKVIELMNKYTGSSMNLIPLETVDMEIGKLKSEECFFGQQIISSRKWNNLLKGFMNHEIFSINLYKTGIDNFHLPTNGPLAEMHSAPIQGMRLSLLVGWIIQFIGPIDKDNELLANVLVSNLEFAIEKDIEKTVEFMRNEVVVRGKEGTRKIFKPYGAQKDNQSKYEKMAEKARLRKLAVQQKKNKKGGNQKESKENYGVLDSQWKDLSDEPIEYSGSTSKEEIRRSIVTIKGHSYGSNYSLLKNGPRKENPQKFFLIDIDELEKLMDMESMMGFEWTKDEKYLEDLESFVKMTGIKKFVLRRLQEERSDSGRFFQLEEAVEVAKICLDLEGVDPNMYGILDALEAEKKSLNKHVRRSRSMREIETMFYMHRVDKSNITVIPDFVEKLSETYSNENLYTPITTVGRKGEDLMNMSESALYIFKNLICGVNWMKAVAENGTDALQSFRNEFEDTLRPLFCEWEACYVAREWHDNIITKLRNHIVFDNQSRADHNIFEGFPKGHRVPTSYFSNHCEANGLPPMPERLPELILMEEAGVLLMVVWACQFFPRQERSKKQGDTAMQRGVIMNAMFARLPQEAKLHNHLANLITHWSEPRESVRGTISHAPTKPGRMQSQQTIDEEARREIDRTLVMQKMKQKKEKKKAKTDEAHETSAKSGSESKDTLVESSNSAQSVPENAKNSSGKTEKPTKLQNELLEKTGKAQEPKKEVKDDSSEPITKKSDVIPELSANEGQGSITSRQEKSKTSTISKQFSRSSSTSTSEPCSSQTPVPESLEKNHGLLDGEAVKKKTFEDQAKKMVKMQNQMEELKEQMKQLSKENETLKSTIEERKEEDSNKLRKAKKELEKEKEKTAKLEQAIKDWKVSLEFMEKDLMEAGEQRDVANEKLRKADEELRDQTAKSRNLEHQLREANKTLATMNKEKDIAVERVVREWTERWNVERHQVQLAQNRTEEAESKVRQLMKDKVKLLEKNPQDGSNLPAHVATYKEDIRKLRQLLKEKEELIPRLQKRIQDLSNQPGPSSQILEDPKSFLERLQNMLEILNRDDSIEEKRVRISRLLTNTDSDETRSLCVLEEDLFDSSVTMYRDTLNYNIFKVQQTQSVEGCQPVPSYPDLSQRFLDAENKERTKAMFGEGDCAICFEKIEDHEEKRTCPNEICGLKYHANCILKSIETMPFCPYCKTPYFNVDDFPVLS
ncbi:hypothetical protein B9Z55_012378 [Caenorhabditis nigoni]|nr:hypothetical protein B9Z55_012378 [Caenorhabditis nigoni]